ncbi:arrestin domain-protein, partial [Cladorrhinum sp. PSN259]
SLFSIRLENNFIIFRGNYHESSAQVLKGTVVLCLAAPLQVKDIYLKLTGLLYYGWTDKRNTAIGVLNFKVNKTIPFYEYERPLNRPLYCSKSQVLPTGNYEWPFEITLPGDTIESIEGLQEASIIWTLKATIARGTLASDLFSYKRLRIIRTLESSALEYLQATSIENIAPNRLEYSIILPQSAIVFGSSIFVKARFTPLLKGLEIGNISITLIELHEIIIHLPDGRSTREHKTEKQINTWRIYINRSEHWQNMIEDTGQEGWVINTILKLPMNLNKCIQDVNAQGIKVWHRLKLVVPFTNPNGHTWELRATLPVTIFISPNIPLDEDGNIQLPAGMTSEQVGAIAPPSYGEHILDHDLNPTSLETHHRHSAPPSIPLIGSPEEPQSLPEHVDYLEYPDLNKVPSYPTAYNTPVTRPLAWELPDYQTALSAPPPLVITESADNL